MHKIKYIYRDIKPDNFVLGVNSKSHLLYLVDYGLCKRYID